ncbi:MAG TPA: cysteine synthase family protein [Myxococcaceae bacterium]|nr:cysteine synthase family protein [Myxococcaceae bacterium]
MTSPEAPSQTPTFTAPPPVAHLLETAAGTPVVRLGRVVPEGGARIFLKLESRLPTGSLKDRVATARLERALGEGRLTAGAPVVVASLGNLGIALAQVCTRRGHRLHVVMPRSASLERRALLRLMGARLELTAMDEGLSGAIRAAEALAQSLPGACLLAADPTADAEVFARGLGAELVAQVQAEGGRIDAFVCGVGSGATLLGVSRALREAFPRVQRVGVEPDVSAGFSGGLHAPHRLQELGLGFVPGGVDASLADSWETVSEREAWDMRLRLAREEGLLVGIGTGANVVAALRKARALGPGAAVYTLASETGERDFSLERALP